MPTSVALARYLMGTRFELIVSGGADPLRLRSAGETVLDEIERLERQLSFYRPESELSGVNARAGRGWVRTDPRFFHLLREAAAISDATGGAFDPSVTPLLRAWGFIGGRGHAADPAELEQARSLVGMHRVLFDAETGSVRFGAPGMALDLGSIGKGYAVDQALAMLQEMGIESALLHGGTSTVGAIGAASEGIDWKIGIAAPPDPDQASADRPVLAAVSLKNGQALSVSALHEKSFVGADGRVYGHVLDPRTGAPVQGVRLAAVIGCSAARTDALSTALLVLGQPGDGPVWNGFSTLVVDSTGATQTTGERGPNGP